GFKGGVDDRGELRIVIGGYVIGDPAGLFGCAVGVRVGATDVPEHRWNAPLRAERSEVLTRRDRRVEFGDPIGAEIAAQRDGNVAGLFGVVDGQRVVLGVGDLRWLRSARGGGLGVDDAFYRGQHAGAYPFVEAPN